MKKIRQAIITGIKTVPKLIPDVLAVVGATSVSIGAFLINESFGYIVVGILLIASAVILSKP